ncbi:MAG: glycosyltransferase family 2 protein [bacterium]
MDISIIIVNYKTRGLLKQCLRGIYKFAPQANFEIIVVDNNSQDGSVEMVAEKFPQVRLLVATENLGYHKGNNWAIKEAKGKHVLILNTDIAFLDSAIQKMHDYLLFNDDVALVGPKLKNPDGSIQMSCMRFPTAMVPIYRRTFLGNLPAGKRKTSQYLMHDFSHQEIRQVDWILGACYMIRRDRLIKVGLMDEKLFLYFGDVALAKQFWDCGWKVMYFADTNIVHYHKRESATSGIFSKIFWIHIFDWFKYLYYYHK